MKGSIERVRAVVNGDMPDRPPLFDLLRNDAVIEHFAAQHLTLDHVDEVVYAAFAPALDATRPSVRLPGEERTVTLDDGREQRHYRWTTWTAHRQYADADAYAQAKRKELDSIDPYAWGPDHEQAMTDMFARIADDRRRLGEVFYVPGIGGPALMGLYGEIGLEPFSYNLADCPDIIEAILESQTARAVTWAEHLPADHGIEAGFLGDDIAFKAGTLLNPAWLREHYFPRLARVIDVWHRQGVRVLFHSDGNLNEILLVMRKVLPIPPDLQISGDMNLTLSGTGDLNKLNVKGTTGIKDLKINADFLENHPFKEKSLKITPDITINASKHTYDLASLNIRSEILDADIKGVLDDEINIDLKGNLSTKFSNLKGQLKGVLPSVFPDQGQLTSDLTIKGSLKNSIAIKGNHRIKDAKIIFPSSGTKPVTPPETISFSKLTVTHDAAYNANQDKLTLMSLKADSSFLNLEASGSLSQISKNLSLQCQGNADLEMQEVQKSLKDFLPEGLTARGKGNITFSCGGNLSSPDDKPMLSTWDGNGSLSVDSINYQTIGSIKDLQTKNLSLKKGVLDSTLMCLLNNGPTRAEGEFDFGKKTPAMKVNLEAKDIQLSQDLKILGYIIPILIIPPSGQLSGKANLSAQASWQGTSWDSEIGKTINGEGELILNDGTIRSQNVLSQVLKSFGKPETLKFKQISTSFRLKDEKIYNDNVQVNAEDLNFQIKGWTSLTYIASQNGNPIEYSITGDFLNESLGRDAKKVLSIIGGGEPLIPVVITGTVQQPKIAIKMPKAGDLIQGIFGSDKKKR